MQALLKVDSPNLMTGLKEEITAHVSIVPTLEDRPKTLVAIEMLTALISSGTIFGEQFCGHAHD